MKRTGFFAIVGRPNVGKSTLLNCILGEKVAIVSSKPQTTRNRILGIETRGEDQFVFIDTPGIFNAKNTLGDYMVKVATGSMQDGDAVILVADAAYNPGDVEEKVIARLRQTGTPAILALNNMRRSATLLRSFRFVPRAESMWTSCWTNAANSCMRMNGFLPRT